MIKSSVIRRVTDNKQKFTDIELAYIAGIVDGEGYVGILPYKQNHNKSGNILYQIVTEITMCEEPAIKLISKFDNKKPYLIRRNPPRRNKYVYRLSAEKAYNFLKLIKKYLLVKSKQTELCLKLQDEIRRKERTGYNKLSIESNNYRFKLYSCCKILNKKGSR